MEVAAVRVPAAAGVDQSTGNATQRGQQQHQRAEPVDHQHDAERRRPVADAVDRDRAAPRPRSPAAAAMTSPSIAETQRDTPRPQQPALAVAARATAAVAEQQQRASPSAAGSSTGRIGRWWLRVGESLRTAPRGRVGRPHGRCRFRARLRSASSMTKPVVAKPITMAVSTSACGSGSATAVPPRQDRRRVAPQAAPSRR